LVAVAAVLIVWIVLDTTIGLAMLVAAIPLLLLATAIADHFSPVAVCSIAAALFVIGWTFQILGHSLFEHRKAAFLDNPMYLLIGPMFVVAKLLVALGLRPDLARLMQPAGEQTTNA